MKYRTEFMTVDLEDVLKYFSKDLEPKSGKIETSEAFVDTVKRKVIFKIVVKED